MKFMKLILKNLKYILIFIFIVSCKKKNEEIRATMTWSFKGKTQICETPIAEIQMGIYHQIHAEMSTSNALYLYPNGFGVGNYTLDSNITLNSALLVYEQSIDSVMFLILSNGTINITKNVDSRITGDFNMLTDQGNTVTGTFENVPIQ